MDEKLGELRRRLDQKTTEIESVVAAEQGIGSIENMNPSDYERLQEDVEELLGRWEETAQEEGPGSMMTSRATRLRMPNDSRHSGLIVSALSLEKLAREKPFCLTSLRSCETSSRLHGLRMICAKAMVHCAFCREPFRLLIRPRIRHCLWATNPRMADRLLKSEGLRGP
jgi:hypothetical protein